MLTSAPGAGPAVDLGVQTGLLLNPLQVGPTTATMTVGVGVGTRAATASIGGTSVFPVTNCGTH